MAWDQITSIIITVLSLLVIPFRHIWNKIMQRFEIIESELKTKTSREEVIEKLEPVKEDLAEIKSKIDKIMDYLLTK